MCAVQGCPAPAPVPHVTALCPAHRRSLGVASSAPWRRGSRSRSDVEARVFSRLGEPLVSHGCWLWPDLSDGHPVVRGSGRWLPVEEVVAGTTVVGRVCGQPTCVNPTHLITHERTQS